MAFKSRNSALERRSSRRFNATRALLQITRLLRSGHLQRVEESSRSSFCPSQKEAGERQKW